MRWSHDGTELFYVEGELTGTRLMVVTVQTDGQFRHDTPRELFVDGGFAAVGSDEPGYDVSADGQRILMAEPVSPSETNRTIRIVNNWFEELKRLAPAD